MSFAQNCRSRNSSMESSNIAEITNNGTCLNPVSAGLTIYADVPSFVACKQHWVSEDDIGTLEKPCDISIDTEITENSQPPDVSTMEHRDSDIDYLSSPYNNSMCLGLHGAGEILSDHWESKTCPRLCEKCDKFDGNDLDVDRSRRKCTCGHHDSGDFAHSSTDVDGNATTNKIGTIATCSAIDTNIRPGGGYSVRAVAQSKPVSVRSLAVVYEDGDSQQPLCMVELGDISKHLPQIRGLMRSRGPLGEDWLWRVGVINSGQVGHEDLAELSPEMIHVILEGSYSWCLSQLKEKSALRIMSLSVKQEADTLHEQVGTSQATDMVGTSQTTDMATEVTWSDEEKSCERSGILRTSNSCEYYEKVDSRDGGGFTHPVPLIDHRSSSLHMSKEVVSCVIANIPDFEGGEKSANIGDDQILASIPVQQNPERSTETGDCATTVSSGSDQEDACTSLPDTRTSQSHKPNDCDMSNTDIKLQLKNWFNSSPLKRTKEVTRRSGTIQNTLHLKYGCQTGSAGFHDEQPIEAMSPEHLNSFWTPTSDNRKTSSHLDKNISTLCNGARSVYGERPDNFTVLQSIIDSVNDSNCIGKPVFRSSDSTVHRNIPEETLVEQSLDDLSACPSDPQLSSVVQELAQFSRMCGQEQKLQQRQCTPCPGVVPKLEYDPQHCTCKPETDGMAIATCGIHQRTDSYYQTMRQYCEGGIANDGDVMNNNEDLQYAPGNVENICSVCGEAERNHSFTGSCPLFFRRVTRRMSQSLDMMANIPPKSSAVRSRSGLAEPSSSHFGEVQGERMDMQNSSRRAAKQRLSDEQLGKAMDNEVQKELKLEDRASSEHVVAEVFKCKNCSLVFTCKDRLCVHIKDHLHSKPYVCHICFKCFAKPPHLSQHLKGHFDCKRFECEQCRKRFAWKCSLKEHMRSHTGEQPFQCSICSKRFARQKNLAQHVRFHTREKPYKCSLCSKAFSWQHSFNRHVLTHTDTKLYACDVCGKRFTQNVAMKNHVLSFHEGGRPRPHQCPLCKKRFIKMSHLNNHLPVHGERIVHTCDKCERSYNWPHDLNRHTCKAKKTKRVKKERTKNS